MHIWWLASLPHPSPQIKVPGALLLHLPLSPYSCSSAPSEMPLISLLPVPHVFWMIYLVIVANDPYIFIDLHKTFFFMAVTLAFHFLFSFHIKRYGTWAFWEWRLENLDLGGMVSDAVLLSAAFQAPEWQVYRESPGNPVLKCRMFPINVNKQHYQSPKMAPRDYWLNSLYCELCAVDHTEDWNVLFIHRTDTAWEASM